MSNEKPTTSTSSKETFVASPTPLALPAPPPSTANESDPIRLDVSTGESVSLYDRLGPTIVASDGALSRIGNWAEMDQLERSRVLRVLGKRNQIRLEAKRNEVENGSGEHQGNTVEEQAKNEAA